MAAAFFLVVILRTYVIPFVASSVALFAEMIQCERYVCPSYSIRGGGEETKMFFYSSAMEKFVYWRVLVDLKVPTKVSAFLLPKIFLDC